MKTLLLLTTSILLSTSPLLGDSFAMAPDFRLRSGDRRTITLENLAKNTVIVFYETEETIDRNRSLKNMLRSLRDSTQDDSKNRPVLLAVADCSSAFWLTTPLWENGLRGKSEQEGYTIYGDWDGKMRENYGFVKDEANFLVLDQNRRIRFKSAGPLSEMEIKAVVELLDRLFLEQ